MSSITKDDLIKKISDYPGDAEVIFELSELVK